MKTTKPAHAPTPWQLNNDVIESKSKRLAILKPYSNSMSDSDSRLYEANAAHIVKCVNNHEKLTNGIAQLLKFYKHTQGLDLPELEALLNEVES